MWIDWWSLPNCLIRRHGYVSALYFLFVTHYPFWLFMWLLAQKQGKDAMWYWWIAPMWVGPYGTKLPCIHNLHYPDVDHITSKYICHYIRTREKIYIMGLYLVSRYLTREYWLIYPVIKFQKLRAQFCPSLMTGSIIYAIPAY